MTESVALVWAGNVAKGNHQFYVGGGVQKNNQNVGMTFGVGGDK